MQLDVRLEYAVYKDDFHLFMFFLTKIIFEIKNLVN